MLQKTDGGQVARLGEGEAAAFSPDGKWVLAFVPSTPPRVLLYPTGTGAERRIDVGSYESIGSLDWFPDGKSILICGNRAGEASRCSVQSLTGGAARAVTPLGTGAGFVAPDGMAIEAFGEALGHRIYPLGGGDGKKIPGLTSKDYVSRWSVDGKALLTYQVTSQTAERFDVATGRRQTLVTFGADKGRFSRIIFATMADDPQVYSYVAARYQSQLFTVDGAR